MANRGRSTRRRFRSNEVPDGGWWDNRYEDPAGGDRGGPKSAETSETLDMILQSMQGPKDPSVRLLPRGEGEGAWRRVSQ